MQFFRRLVAPDQLPPSIRIKFEREKLLDEGVTPIPKRLARSLSALFQDMSMEHLQVILAVIDFRRPNATRSPSIEFLAFIAGLDVEVFRRRLDELVAKGWLSREGADDEVRIGTREFERVVMQKTRRGEDETGDDNESE